MSKTEIVKLGEFEIISGNVVITDPCYNLDTWCQGKLEGVKNGKWYGIVEYSDEGNWGNRCSQIFAIHESEMLDSEYKLERKLELLMGWSALNFDIGVDSGQAGIFDLDMYQKDEGICLPEDSPVNWKDDKLWYLLCCDKTLREQSAGVIPGGVVSSSGYGDGSYIAYQHKNENGEITGIKIEFIEEEDNTCSCCGYEDCRCDYEE